MLQGREEIEIIGECRTGQEAADFISNDKPDLIFMEVEMPDLNGFKVVESIVVEPNPLIVFTSSYQDYAVQAFEFEALDYIQKPIDPSRIEKTLNRLAKRLINGLSNGVTKNIGTLFQENTAHNSLERFIIKQSGEYHLVRADSVICIEADGNYSRIITRDKKFMIRYTLSGFEGQLDPRKFFRISRSQIVNLDYVVKIKDHLYGNYIIELENGMTIKMSKNYRKLLDELKNF